MARQTALVCLAELILLLIGWKLGSFFVPLVFVLAAFFVLLAYRSPETAWLLTWVATPLSTEVTLPGGMAFAMPTEPMMVIALLAWLLRAWPWRGLSRGPASIARPLGTLAAIALVSVVASRSPIIGTKAWVMAGLYAAFGYSYLVSTGYRASRVILWLGLGVAIGSAVALYASLNVLMNGVGIRVAYGAARPFFVEHGTYAAYLALLLPSAVLESLAAEGSRRLTWALGAGMLALGVVLSFTRAAWLSVAITLPVCLVLWALARGSARRLWIPASIVLLLVLGLSASGIGGRLGRHARTTLASDNVSNLERLNRWMAAAEMAKAHPWTGVGYGMYPDAYREYRRKSIVTEQAYGRFGAHNEWLRLLAETGWAGLAASLWFAAAVAWVGLRPFLRDPHSDRGRIALGLTCGLATYAVHSLFNSYLGIDKISIPFWVFIGTIAAIAMSPPKVAPSASAAIP